MINKELVTKIAIGGGIIVVSYFIYKNINDNSIADAAKVASDKAAADKAAKDALPKKNKDGSVAITKPIVKEDGGTISGVVSNKSGDLIGDDSTLYDKSGKEKGTLQHIGSLDVFVDSNGKIIASSDGLPASEDSFGNIVFYKDTIYTPDLSTKITVDYSNATYKEVGDNKTIYNMDGSIYVPEAHTAEEVSNPSSPYYNQSAYNYDSTLDTSSTDYTGASGKINKGTTIHKLFK